VSCQVKSGARHHPTGTGQPFCLRSPRICRYGGVSDNHSEIASVLLTRTETAGRFVESWLRTGKPILF